MHQCGFYIFIDCYNSNSIHLPSKFTALPVPKNTPLHFHTQNWPAIPLRAVHDRLQQTVIPKHRSMQSLYYKSKYIQ